MRTAWEVAADQFDPPELRWMADPVAWTVAQDLFLWSKQCEIIESVRDHFGTAVQSCHSSGKSYTAAAAVCWWLSSHPPGTAFVVTSAPTGAQIKAILWREIGKMHVALGLKGRTNLTEWYINGELVGFGRKPADHNPNGFQGIHAQFVLVVLDEACGIPKTLWDASYSIASNENGRVLAIGNPDDPTSEFAKICESKNWHNIRIAAQDTPNFTGEQVPKLLSDNLVSTAYVQRAQDEWGVDSPIYISKVEGRFPLDAKDGVIPGSWVAQCHILDLPEKKEPLEAGLDPARDGEDKAVLWLRQGKRALQKWTWAFTPDPKQLAEFVLAIMQERGVTSLKIDGDGLGWGIAGIFDVWQEQGLHQCEAVPIYGSKKADNDSKFFNKRAEVWWQARERTRLHEWDLGALDDDDMADLTASRYKINPAGKIQLEKKEDIKKRIGHSPDSADALLLAFEHATFEATAYGSQLAAIDILGR